MSLSWGSDLVARGPLGYDFPLTGDFDAHEISIRSCAGLPRCRRSIRTGSPESRPLAQPAPAPGIENALFVGLRWRSIGPSRGGRSIAVAGSSARRDEPLRRDRRRAVEDQRWRRGAPYRTVSSRPRRSVPSPSPSRIPMSFTPEWAKCSSAATSFRETASTSRLTGGGPGRTPASRRQWSSAASASTANPDIVYVAALGDPYGPNLERGVYKTTDGGKTWTSVLSRNDKTGAADLAMDRRTPRSSMPDAGRSSARRIRCPTAARAAACSRQRTAATRGRS